MEIPFHFLVQFGMLVPRTFFLEMGLVSYGVKGWWFSH